MTLQTGPDLRDMPTPASRGRANGGSDRKFVSALARGLEVLRAFTPSEGLLGNGELVERTGLPKPTVSRLTYTLTKVGYLTYVERLGKYQLTPAALALGYSALADLRIRQIARRYMHELAASAGGASAPGSAARPDLIWVEPCRRKRGAVLRCALG